MINSIFVAQLLIIFDLGYPRVVSDQVEHICWVVGRLQSHHFEVVILECDQILSMPGLLVPDHAVTLLSEFLVHYNIIAVTQDLAHYTPSFLCAYRIIVDRG